MIKEKLKYGKSSIDYNLEFSKRKTLGIKVHPNKQVQVIAPLNSDIEKVREKVHKKASWILKQQDFFLSFHPLTPSRKYVSGETHLYLGKQYRLKLIETQNESVKINGGYIQISVNSKGDKIRIKKLLKEWYKQKAILHFNTIFNENISLSKKIYKETPILKYRWMSKRWGSCDKNGVINLNLELIKAPKSCIEYIIIHEMCHLKHLNHSKAFFELLQKVYPKWKTTKDRLEKLMV